MGLFAKLTIRMGFICAIIGLVLASINSYAEVSLKNGFAFGFSFVMCAWFWLLISEENK